MTRDLRTLIYLLNLELREECSRRLQADAGSSSRSGHNRGAAAEADASGEHAAAAEAVAIGEQQLEADANGKQQMKRIQSGQGTAAESKRTQASSSS